MSRSTTTDAAPALPWWRFGIVWLVFGGPAVVVVAALTTVWIAERNADVEIIDPPAAQVAAPQGAAPAPAAPAAAQR